VVGRAQHPRGDLRGAGGRVALAGRPRALAEDALEHPGRVSIVPRLALPARGNPRAAARVPLAEAAGADAGAALGAHPGRDPGGDRGGPPRDLPRHGADGPAAGRGRGPRRGGLPRRLAHGEQGAQGRPPRLADPLDEDRQGEAAARAASAPGVDREARRARRTSARRAALQGALERPRDPTSRPLVRDELAPDMDRGLRAGRGKGEPLRGHQAHVRDGRRGPRRLRARPPDLPRPRRRALDAALCAHGRWRSAGGPAPSAGRGRGAGREGAENSLAEPRG
jgi:hypothetical protein